MDDWRRGIYFRYSQLLLDRFGQKVYKIPFAQDCTCPNRDGTKGRGGCIFCAEGASGYDLFPIGMPIEEQAARNIAYIRKKYRANLFEAYAQNYSNTYLPLESFRQSISACLSTSQEFVMLTVSTRPDCINTAVLDVLKETASVFGVEITVELGLQSVNSNTLVALNRRHTLSDYLQSIALVKSYGFHACTHLILSLPWDTMEDVREAARLISVLCGYGDSVKGHTLYVEKGTKLSEMYNDGRFSPIPLESYIQRACEFLSLLSPDIAVQRLNARLPQQSSEFCNWGRSHWVLDGMIENYMMEKGWRQGARVHEYGASSALRDKAVLKDDLF